MSQKNRQPVDPVEAMKILRTPAQDGHQIVVEGRVNDLLNATAREKVEEDLTPGVLPTMPVTTKQKVWIVEEDKLVFVRGLQCRYLAGRELVESAFGEKVIQSLLEQGLKMRCEERDL